jgi:hypothetical protein
MEDRQSNEPQRWERAGLVIGLVIALAIMWGVLAFALVAGDGQSTDSPNVIYDQSAGSRVPDEDE